MCEIAQCFSSGNVSTLFIRRALNFGVKFTPDEIVELVSEVYDDIHPELLSSNSEPYTVDHIDKMNIFVDEELLENLRSQTDKHSNHKGAIAGKQSTLKIVFGSIWLILKAFFSVIGVVFTFIYALLAVLFNTNPQHNITYNGVCDGDCANCPPHYGYRHGRWYYGHGHIEGCEFGGNKGDGGRD